jgi:BlaI family transcriptional regulator, penicillinase repressor
MTKMHYELTAGEWEIIRAVWELEPCAAPSVQEALFAKKKWSYSTVKTIMDRMVEKGLLKTERIRNLMLYRAIITRPEAQKGELMRTLQQAFNGALTPMMQFLLKTHDLSENDLKELEKLLKDKKAQIKDKKK